MAVYRRTRPRFILALLVLSSVTLITLDGRGRAGMIDATRRVSSDVIGPITRGFDAAVDPVRDWAGSVARAGSLRRENTRLERQVRALRNKLGARADDARQNDELKRLLALTEPLDAHPIAAHVFAGAAGNFSRTVQIDRGSADGVTEDMPVVSADGLVGRVSKVPGRHSATVVLITDPSTAVGVRFVTSGEIAVANGGVGDLRVDFVDTHAAIERGELAVTAGLAHARYPAGIPVGVVTKLGDDPAALQRKVWIRPVARLDRLDVVRLLHYTPPEH